MISDQELTGIVRTFLEDGADGMPDRVYRAAMDAVPGTRRRGTWNWPWHDVVRPLPSLLRGGLVAAMLLVVAAAGFTLLSVGGGIGLRPTPAPSAGASAIPSGTPTATPTPTSLPSGGPVASMAAGTVLGAGTYEVGAPFVVPFSIELPAESTFFATGPGRASFGAPDGSIELYLPDAVFADPCHVQGSPAPTRTAAQVVDRLTSMAGVSATTPTSTTVAGYPATVLVLTNTIDTATANCTRGPMLPLFSYVGETEDGAATNGGTRQVVWVVDVDGRPLLVIGDGWHDTVRGDLEAIVRTIRIH